MKNFNTNTPLLLSLVLTLALGFTQVTIAQSPITADQNIDKADIIETVDSAESELSAQLEELSSVVQKKTKELNVLKATAAKAKNKTIETRLNFFIIIIYFI